jgi:(p)ppGpp synthase/HD superfamily hydrolase
LPRSPEGTGESRPAAAVDHQAVRTAPGKGLPHAQAVADILRDAGYEQQVQVVALLHDVVEDTPRSIEDVRDAFGKTIAAMVEALTEDACSGRQLLRITDRNQDAGGVI